MPAECGLKISIIIPAFNEEQLLPATLASIKVALGAFSRRGWQTELIVCDNNSTDRTGEIARAAGATVVFEGINQIARARNSGAAAASGDWFVFIDADSLPSVELFDSAAERILAGDTLVMGALVKMETDSRFGCSLIKFWNWVSRTFKLCAGSFIFCEADAFREVGGFSHELYASEEIDLSKRLKKLAAKKGKRVVILQEHPLETSARKLKLYRLREYLVFISRTIFTGGRALRSREACVPWYDGRR